jgi:3-hydroxyacyl-[acyl-carrier-protein] dehydratase
VITHDRLALPGRARRVLKKACGASEEAAETTVSHLGGPRVVHQAVGNLHDHRITYGKGTMVDSPLTPMDQVIALDCQRVTLLLPHRYPLLLVDRVIALVREQYIHGVKNIAITESFFQGHLPNRPVMPGVLVMEALARACGILALESGCVTPQAGSVVHIVGIDKGRFRKPVMACDQLILKAILLRTLRGIWKFETRAEVDGDEVASAQLMISPEPRIER